MLKCSFSLPHYGNPLNLYRSPLCTHKIIISRLLKQFSKIFHVSFHSIIILLKNIGPLPFVSIFVDLSQYPAKLNTFWQKPYFNILALPHPHLRFGHTKQIFTKKQLHFSQTILQVRIKSCFP